ncbi:MAG: hypothetical protein ACT4O2_03600, partial [Beijerinckiaceae bacterium]
MPGIRIRSAKFARGVCGNAAGRAIEGGDDVCPESPMAMTTAALDLCRALIRCPSVTPEDGGAL